MNGIKRIRTQLPSDASGALALARNSGLPPDAMADLEAGRAKLIPLTQGKVTLVDTASFEDMNQWKWFFGAGYYAVRFQSKKMLLLHRIIANTPFGLMTDHINGHCLDNRRSNLRFATPSQNALNKRVRVSAVSGLKGASWHKRAAKWQAVIQLNYKSTYIGLFDTKEQAHAAYCIAAKSLFGEFCRIN